MKSGASHQDMERVFLAHLSHIDRASAYMARRHHLSATDAEEFASYVKERLIDDDYAILRKFQARSTLPTYLSTVIGRLCQDFRNSAWGKWRPSAYARRVGAVAELLEQFIVRDGLTFEAACEMLWTNHRVSLTRAELEDIAAGMPVRMARRFEPVSALAGYPSHGRAVDYLISDDERFRQAERIFALLREALDTLGDEDRFILKRRYWDGATVADIAREIPTEQKPLYVRIGRLAGRLRVFLKQRGIDRSAISQFLGPEA